MAQLEKTVRWTLEERLKRVQDRINAHEAIIEKIKKKVTRETEEAAFLECLLGIHDRCERNYDVDEGRDCD